MIPPKLAAYQRNRVAGLLLCVVTPVLFILCAVLFSDGMRGCSSQGLVGRVLELCVTCDGRATELRS